MARSVSVDMTAFVHALEKAPEVVGAAAKRGMHDALDEWQRESTDIAPLDKGTLRRGFSTEVDGEGMNLTGSITAVAVENRAGKRFNYAYWLHEVYPEKRGESFAKPTTAGTVPQFIDKVAEQREDQWKRDIESEIKRSLEREGW